MQHEYIGTEHLLLGLLGNAQIRELLQPYNLTSEQVAARVKEIMVHGPDAVTLDRLPWTPRALHAAEFAREWADNDNEGCIHPVHLLRGLIQEEKGIASQVLFGFGVTIDLSPPNPFKPVNEAAPPDENVKPSWVEIGAMQEQITYLTQQLAKATRPSQAVLAELDMRLDALCSSLLGNNGLADELDWWPHDCKDCTRMAVTASVAMISICTITVWRSDADQQIEPTADVLWDRFLTRALARVMDTHHY